MAGRKQPTVLLALLPRILLALVTLPPATACSRLLPRPFSLPPPTNPPSALRASLPSCLLLQLLAAAPALFPARVFCPSLRAAVDRSAGSSMNVAAAPAGAAQVRLDLEVELASAPAAPPASLQAAAPTEREAKRRRVGPPGGPAAAAGGGGGGAPGRRVQAAATAVQRLFQACRHVFRGPGTVPKPAEVQLLRDMLDRMRPEDVGLSPDLRFFRTRDVTQGIPTITHTTIYKCPNFSMVILFLPRNAVIPLHNHPGMTVFSKLLLGSMHIKSYDWLNPQPDPSVSTSSSSSPSDGQLRLAKLVVDDVFTAPCDTSVLYPTTGGNMHRFTAIAPCAILDILGPPYSIEEDRDCTYYTDIPYTRHPTAVDDTGDDLEQSQGRLAWLKEIDMPKELKMCSVHYGGPLISDK